jgi:ectoine hydroxylase-related dioxygenase (phytanoyl-CoA dioxygenase family)
VVKNLLDQIAALKAENAALRSNAQLLDPLAKYALTDEAGWMKHYDHFGFVILEGVIDPETVNAACIGLNKLVCSLADRLVSAKLIGDRMEHLSFHDRISALCAACPEELPNLYRAELHTVPEMFPLLCHEAVLHATRRVLSKAKSIRLYPNYSVRPKTKHGIHQVTWHQDAGLRGDGGPSMIPMEERLDAFGLGTVVNCWTCLGSEANVENGCMRFIPGSQSMGVLEHVPQGSYKSGCVDVLSKAEKKDVVGGKGLGGATTSPPGELWHASFAASLLSHASFCVSSFLSL